MNSRLLKRIIALNDDTQERLADALGISLSNLNAKINGTGASFRQTEIAAIKSRYHMSAKDVDAVFFCFLIVSKRQKTARGRRAGKEGRGSERSQQSRIRHSDAGMSAALSRKDHSAGRAGRLPDTGGREMPRNADP